MLSISLAFGTETKPVTNKSITIEPNPKDKVASSEKKSENSKKVFGTPECYALSCKVVCTEVYGPQTLLWSNPLIIGNTSRERSVKNQMEIDLQMVN